MPSVLQALENASTQSAEPNEKAARVDSGLSSENNALLAAMSKLLDEKLDKKMEKVDKAIHAVAEAADKGFSDIRKEVDKERKARAAFESDMIKTIGALKSEIGNRTTAPTPSLTASGGTATVRARSVGSRGRFVPTKVFVQGFYNFAEDKGALRVAERAALSERLLSHVPENIRKN